MKTKKLMDRRRIPPSSAALVFTRGKDGPDDLRVEVMPALLGGLGEEEPMPTNAAKEAFEAFLLANKEYEHVLDAQEHGSEKL